MKSNIQLDLSEHFAFFSCNTFLIFFIFPHSLYKLTLAATHCNCVPNMYQRTFEHLQSGLES